MSEQINKIMTQIEELDEKIDKIQKQRDYHMRRLVRVILETRSKPKKFIFNL